MSLHALVDAESTAGFQLPKKSTAAGIVKVFCCEVQKVQKVVEAWLELHSASLSKQHHDLSCLILHPNKSKPRRIALRVCNHMPEIQDQEMHLSQ